MSSNKDQNQQENKNETKDVKSVLRDVIQILQDSQRGFVEVGERIKDDTLKRYFLAESLKRARFRADLENELHRQGVHDVNEGGTIAGTMHRTWAELKAKLGGGDHALLESAERGEDAAKEAYDEALKHDLPLPIHQMLSEQRAHVLTSHDYVRDNRDALQMKKAS